MIICPHRSALSVFYLRLRNWRNAEDWIRSAQHANHALSTTELRESTWGNKAKWQHCSLETPAVKNERRACWVMPRKGHLGQYSVEHSGQLHTTAAGYEGSSLSRLFTTTKLILRDTLCLYIWRCHPAIMANISLPIDPSLWNNQVPFKNLLC